MLKLKAKLFILIVICIVITVISVFFLGGIDNQSIQIWLEQMGVYAPIVYIFIYTLGTLLILPSTPLNLAGGALFGIWWGVIWTSIAAIIAAVISFAFTRSLGREYITKKLGRKWKTLDLKIRQGGVFYMIAIRLLPVIPYGLVNFSAGLTSISFKDYLVGTSIGTLPGILPFVIMGSGLTQLSQGDITSLIVGLTLTGILVGTATILKTNGKI